MTADIWMREQDERAAAGMLHDTWLAEQDEPSCLCSSGQFNCNQGRACPVREACRLPERDITDVSERWAHRIILALGIAAGFMAVAGLFGGPT